MQLLGFELREHSNLNYKFYLEPLLMQLGIERAVGCRLVGKNRTASVSVSARSGTAHREIPAASRQVATYERILRYPDGKERRIRYPVVEDEPDSRSRVVSHREVDCSITPDSHGCEPDWEIPRYSDRFWQETGADGGQVTRPARKNVEKAASKTAALPSTPGDLLRYFSSDAYKQAQKEQWERVRNSYEVLEGCPWVLPRAVYVLAVAQAGRDDPLTFTLRTRVGRKDVESELSKVLKKQRKNGANLIQVTEMRDGVVVFENAGDAERFGSWLEADGQQKVQLAEVNSHALFRMVGDTRGVAVLLRENCDLPMPDELAASVRGQRSWEELDD